MDSEKIYLTLFWYGLLFSVFSSWMMTYSLYKRGMRRWSDLVFNPLWFFDIVTYFKVSRKEHKAGVWFILYWIAMATWLFGSTGV